tara:strand:+ start:399 stop:839 length:441 start_codon:yes stop_codon:yes gene_type:complete
MFDNIHLYIIIGILGSITPVMDKFNLENMDWYNYLFIREFLFSLFLLIFIYYKKDSLGKVLNLKNEGKILCLLGSLISIVYVCLIFKTFSLEFGSQAISKIVTVMVITTMIFTFLVDKLYFKAKFSNENYLGLFLLFLGIYFLKKF